MADLHRISGWAGRRRSSAHQLLTRLAGGALGLSVLLLAVVALRPLPGAPASEPAALPVIPSAHRPSDALAQREQRLRALEGMGNVFASGRAAWEPMAEADPEPEPDTAQPPPAQVVTQADPAHTGSSRLAAIPLTALPSAAAKKSRDSMALRGLLVAGDRRLAMIQGGTPRERNATDVYREGQVFSAETWKILRIDEDNDRVILEHLGQGDILELTMYDASAPALTAAPASGLPAVQTADLAEARRSMTEAGIPGDEVDSVFAILDAMEKGEPIPADDAAVTAAAPPREKRVDENGRPELPPEFAALLRSMMSEAAASKEREN